jgi:putative oxidoreductase
MARTIDSIAVRNEGVLLLLGRLGIAALFLPSGLEKLLDLSHFEGVLAAKGLPLPLAWAVLAALIEFLGGLALAVGFRVRYVALLLIIFTIVATLLAHAFWMVGEPAPHQAQQIQFFKNLAIIGGLLYVFVRGAGAISIDRR